MIVLLYNLELAIYCHSPNPSTHAKKIDSYLILKKVKIDFLSTIGRYMLGKKIQNKNVPNNEDKQQ